MSTFTEISSANVRDVLRRHATLEHPDDRFEKFLREFKRYSLDMHARITFILPHKHVYEFHCTEVGLVKVAVIRVPAWPCSPPPGFRKFRTSNIFRNSPKNQACIYSA
jgi:hypothetical protein